MHKLVLAMIISAGALACVQPSESDESESSGGVAAGAGAPAPGGTTAPPPAGAGGQGGAGAAAPVVTPPTAGASGAGAGGAGGAGSGGAGAGGAAGAAGAAGSAGAAGGAGSAGTSGAGAGAGAGGAGAGADLADAAAGLHELFMHDECTGAYPSQPDTCLHAQLVEQAIAFGGEEGTVYEVTLRVRGLFEPTTINGGQAPLGEHPYFKVGGTVAAVDWSHWHIEVSDPPQTYWLNHYPSTSHVIYKEDFEATLQIAGGADVVVRVIDGNDRQMDNAEEGLADRRQLIEGVTDEVLDGQMLRLDVVSVEEAP